MREPTATTRAKRDLARRRLANLLAMADDRLFLQMIWAVDRMRTGEFAVGARALRDIPADLQARLSDKADLYIMPWILEDLVNEVLTTPKPRIVLPRQLNCESYSGFRGAYQYMLAVDEAESGFELGLGRDVLEMMPRFGHRQFDWQTGWLNAALIYRTAYIYGQGNCAAWFAEQNGITPSDFLLFSVGAYVNFVKRPYVEPHQMRVAELGLDQRVIEGGLRLMSRGLREVRSEATSLRPRLQNMAAKPSILRRYPIIHVPGVPLMCPIPELLQERSTSGLYLDLVRAPGGIRNEFAKRFEGYAFDLLSSVFGDRVRREYEYGPPRAAIRTPDIFIGAQDEIKIIVECKATRMSFAARFSDDWRDETERGYRELAKGVGQIWRHASHMRRGLVPDRPSPEMIGHVLTLDPWMRLTLDQDEVIQRMAREWCAENDNQIIAEDECPIGFTHIADLERLLHRTDEDGVVAVLRSATQKVGWGSGELGREEGVAKVERPYLLVDRMPEILPWFKKLSPFSSD